MPPVFIFDLDGTLLFLGTDWEGVKKRLADIYISYGLKVESTSIFKSISEAVESTVDLALKKKVLADTYKVLEEEEIVGAKRADIRDGALVLLNHLKRYRLAIVSSNCKRAALTALRNVGIDEKLFSVMVMRDDVENLKPHPEPLLNAIKRIEELEKKTQRFVFIGDQKNDVLCAKAAADIMDGVKIDTVAVCGGATGEDELKATDPDFFARDLKGVLAIIEENY